MRRALRSLLPAVLPALAAAAGAFAYENGAPPGHTGGFGEHSCHACHSDNPVNERRGRLAVSGLPERYVPRERYALVVTLEHPALESGGFQMSLRTADGRPAGGLEPGSARVATVRSEAGIGYAQHTSSGRDTGTPGRIRWTVTWQAPEDGGAVTLNAAANAANDDLSALGDFVYTLERRIAPGDRDQ